MSEKITFGDGIFIALLFLLCLFALFFPKKGDGTRVEISVAGEVTETLDLNGDKTVVLNDGTEITVENGTVRVSHAVCPDKICEKARAISREGDLILCLPERIAIRLIGSEVDAVVG